MNFENLPNPEKEEPLYLEKLREAIEEGRQFVTTPEAVDYVAKLEQEFGSAESEWEEL